MRKNDESKPLWEKYFNIKNRYIKNPSELLGKELESAKNELIVYYLPMVHEIGNRMAGKLKEITAEECSSYGLDGLYEAIDKFDPEREIQFKTFATYRIKGSILDNIRQTDWVPRLSRQRNNAIEKVRNSYYKEKGFYPSDQEVAEILNYSEEDFEYILKKSVPVSMLSISSKSKSVSAEEPSDNFENVTIKDENKEPINNVLREEMFKKLLGSNFTRQERQIIYFHYYENFSIKEIAKKMNFSESRVTQIHAATINKLKQKIQRNPNYASGLQDLFKP